MFLYIYTQRIFLTQIIDLLKTRVGTRVFLPLTCLQKFANKQAAIPHWAKIQGGGGCLPPRLKSTFLFLQIKQVLRRPECLVRNFILQPFHVLQFFSIFQPSIVQNIAVASSYLLLAFVVLLLRTNWYKHRSSITFMLSHYFILNPIIQIGTKNQGQVMQLGTVFFLCIIAHFTLFSG